MTLCVEPPPFKENDAAATFPDSSRLWYTNCRGLKFCWLNAAVSASAPATDPTNLLDDITSRLDIGHNHFSALIVTLTGIMERLLGICGDPAPGAEYDEFCDMS